jgi:hypothetical protein
MPQIIYQPDMDKVPFTLFPVHLPLQKVPLSLQQTGFYSFYTSPDYNRNKR